MLRDNKSKRLLSDKIDADKTALDALRTLSDYRPINAELEVANLIAIYDKMISEQTAETQARIVWETQRDATVKSEHLFHDLMIRAYDAVRGQYGRDSSQVQAMGRKRVSEYRRPTRKKTDTEEK